MSKEKEIKLSLNEKLQIFLMGFEEALFKRCLVCGQPIKKGWSPQEWADKLEVLIGKTDS
jgi:hypothetical protein